jgi:hypothetical protein
MSSNNQAVSAHSQASGRQSIARILWLLPIVFIIHDGEELLTIPSWIASHQRELDQIAKMSEVAAKLMRSLPTTTTQVAIAIGFILLLFIVVTIGASMSSRRGLWIYTYASLLGGLFLHVFTHIGQAVLVGGYVPGIIGAVAVVIPGTIYIYKRLFEEKFLTLKSAAFVALIGLALFVPGAMLAHQIGRILGGG